MERGMLIIIENGYILILVIHSNSKHNFNWLLCYRYISVHFSAWELAGTDNLWAGIVTNISHAIEQEFGVVATRLFRIANPINDDCDVDDSYIYTNRIFAKFDDDSERVKSVLESYGVLMTYERYQEYIKETGSENPDPQEQTPDVSSGQWTAEYRSFVQAQYAVDELQEANVEASFNDPFEGTKKHKASSDSEHQPLISGSESSSSASPKITFTTLLAKYPKTACGVPTFIWTLLIIFLIIVPIPLALSANTVSCVSTHINCIIQKACKNALKIRAKSFKLTLAATLRHFNSLKYTVSANKILNINSLQCRQVFFITVPVLEVNPVCKCKYFCNDMRTLNFRNINSW